MSHLVEPSVISEALLQQCVEEQGPDGEAGRIARVEGIEFHEVTTLRLDFKNILRIEHLWQFKNLRKLQLDNNIIERIEGLDQLVNLEWLDLSFNNIDQINGLDALMNLKDLSLANNRITQIQNLEKLTKLQILSIAGNNVKELGNVAYLRQFGNLQCLALKGNPMTEDPRYPHYVIAYIPSLLYLDYQLVPEDTRQAAAKMFQEEMDELALQERELQRRAGEQAAVEQKKKSLHEAYIDGLQQLALFNAMFEEDKDADCFKLIPGVPELLESYSTGFVTVCEELTTIGLQEWKRRNDEAVLYFAANKQVCANNQKMSVSAVQNFEKLKHQLFISTHADSTKLKTAIGHLYNDLMRLEMLLVEQIEEAAKDFERNYTELVSIFLEQVQAHMARLRDLENSHHETLTEKAQVLLDKFIKNQLDIELPDELRVLLVDKDTLIGALNAGHDSRLLVIDNKEDSIVSKAKKERDVLIETVQNSELRRNRQKVIEIEQYIALQKDECDILEQQN